MTTAHAGNYYDNGAVDWDGPRIAAFFGILLLNLGSIGVGLFWLMGATHLLTDNGGLINELNLTGVEQVLYWSYPVVVLVSLAAWLFYLARLEIVGLTVAAMPIGLMVLYYLWLVLIRAG